MTELPHQTKERKSWFSFILKLAFFIIAFALIIFTVLANMGGSGPGMKQAVESFFSDITGYRASIVKFNRMIFFPDIVIDFEHMQLYDGAENTAPVATIGRLQLAMSFWDVMFSTGKIRQMNLEDAVVNAGVLVPAAVKIETARIFDEGGDQAMLEIKGFVDKNPLEIKADMKAFGVAPWKKYRFGDERRVDVSLGGLKLSALVKSQAHEGFSFEGIKLAMPESAAEGSLSFRNRGYGHFAVRGDLRLTENGTALQPDLIFNLEQFPPLLSGVVKIPSLHLNDFKESSRFIRVHDFLRENLLADLRTEIAADVRLDIAAAQGLGDWLGPENTKTLLPPFYGRSGF